MRTAWLYGAGGGNFVKTMARLAGERETLAVVDDQRGQPTWTVDLADAIVRLVTEGAPFGVWHGTSSGETTWHGFTQEIFRLLGLDPARVEPTTTDAFPRPAPRPAYSVLGHESWQMARLGAAPGLARVVGQGAAQRGPAGLNCRTGSAERLTPKSALLMPIAPRNGQSGRFL